MASALRRTLAPNNQQWVGRTLTQEEAREVADTHFRFLKRKPGGAPAILNSAVMAGLDLSHTILSEAQMSGADLKGARLTAAVLDRSNLFAADLRGCDLRFASLIGADVRGASLRGADLSLAILDNADFRSAVMLRQTPNGDSVKELPNSGHIRGGVDFSGASLKSASFKGAALKGVNFKDAILQGAAFKSAKFENVCLTGAVLTDVFREELPFSDAELRGAVLAPTREAAARCLKILPLLQEHERWVTTGGRDGQAAILDDEDIRPLSKSLKGRELTAICCRRVLGVGADFSGSQLQGANFECADLRDANFTGADLRGTNFKGANLSYATFDKADIRSLPMPNRALPVNFTDARFRQEQFARSVHDKV